MIKLLDEKGLTTVWAAIKNTFTSKSDADGKYAKKVDLDGYIKKGDAVNDVSFVHDTDSVQLGIYNYDGDTLATGYINAADYKNAGVMSSVDKNKLDGIQSGANKYSLPVASSTVLGGIKASVDYDQDHCFPICTDANGVAYAKIDGISKYDGATSSYKAEEDTNYTIYGYNEINSKVGDGLITLRLPSGPGTLALASDIPKVPDVSDLCKANIMYDISKCKEGATNIFINNSDKDFSVDSIKDKSGMVVFAYVTKNCNITTSANMILYNNTPNFTGKVSVTSGMFLIIPNVNNIVILSF